MSVKVLAKDKIVQAYNLINHLEPLHVCNVFGVPKLKRKIEAEIKFLNKSLRNNDIKEEHVHCSNIGQLASLVEVATSIPGVTAVLKSFDIGDGEKLIIDVVGENNSKWYKVILRNPKALHQLHIFGGRNGVRPLDAVARDILNAAKANPVFFVPPKVCFCFVNGVSERLAKSLQLLGVEVKGQIKTSEELGVSNIEPICDSSSETEAEDNALKSNDEDSSITSTTDSVSKKLVNPDQLDNSDANLISSSQCSSPSSTINKKSLATSKNGELYRRVNLDVSCLIAYVSSTSNGGCHFAYGDKFVNEQAMLERKSPVKDVLNAYFKGKELLVCEEVAMYFRSILEAIAGEGERKRGYELLKRCTIVPGQPIFDGILKIGNKIKEFSRLVFSTGHALKAPTITSNKGFVRSAQSQGLKLAVLYHEPRALTEKKELMTQRFTLSEVESNEGEEQNHTEEDRHSD